MTTPSMETIERIKAEARYRGKTYAQIALETGISYDRVARLLTGVRPPRPGELERIARAAGAPLELLEQGTSS